MTSLSSNEPAGEPLVTAEGESLPSDPRKIRYVDVEAPRPGELVEIAPNICWTRIPLPIDLNHINVWLIDTGDQYVVADTGMTPQMCKGAWEQLERSELKQKPVGGIFVTHAHPDHIGLAQWLQDRYRVDTWMSEDTLSLARAVYVERAPRADAHLGACEDGDGAAGAPGAHRPPRLHCRSAPAVPAHAHRHHP